MIDQVKNRISSYLSVYHGNRDKCSFSIQEIVESIIGSEASVMLWCKCSSIAQNGSPEWCEMFFESLKESVKEEDQQAIANAFNRSKFYREMLKKGF